MRNNAKNDNYSKQKIIHIYIYIIKWKYEKIIHLDCARRNAISIDVIME